MKAAITKLLKHPSQWSQFARKQMNSDGGFGVGLPQEKAKATFSPGKILQEETEQTEREGILFRLWPRLPLFALFAPVKNAFGCDLPRCVFAPGQAEAVLTLRMAFPHLAFEVGVTQWRWRRIAVGEAKRDCHVESHNTA